MALFFRSFPDFDLISTDLILNIAHTTFDFLLLSRLHLLPRILHILIIKVYLDLVYTKVTEKTFRYFIKTEAWKEDIRL